MLYSLPHQMNGRADKIIGKSNSNQRSACTVTNHNALNASKKLPKTLNLYQIIDHTLRIIEHRNNSAKSSPYLNHNKKEIMKATLENINRKTDNRFVYALGLFCLLSICISEFPEDTKLADTTKTELIASNMQSN